MLQPIVKKYKQGELGMPYPKKKNKNNLNLSAYGGEADPEIATKDYPSKPNNHVQSSFWKKANEKDYQEETMPQPIMKKYKHGEMGMEYGMPSKEKIQSGMNKKYSHGEFSDAGGKSANPKPESWSKAKIKQGSFNN